MDNIAVKVLKYILFQFLSYKSYRNASLKG